MRVRSFEKPENIEKVSSLELGGLLHQLYEEFYRDLKQEGKLPLQQNLFDELLAKLTAMAIELLTRFEYQSSGGLPVLMRSTRDKIISELSAFLNSEIEKANGWIPDEFEVKFNAKAQEQLGETYGAVEIPLLPEYIKGAATNQETLRFRFSGIIDRLDRSSDNWQVIDYKTGGTVYTKKLKQGTQLQRQIYILAARKMKGVDSVSSAEYRSTTSDGGFISQEIKSSDLDKQNETMVALLSLLAGNFESGNFMQQVSQSTCRYCSMSGTACEEGRKERYENKNTDPQRQHFDQIKIIE